MFIGLIPYRELRCEIFFCFFCYKLRETFGTQHQLSFTVQSATLTKQSKNTLYSALHRSTIPKKLSVHDVEAGTESKLSFRGHGFESQRSLLRVLEQVLLGAHEL